jgi:uncharacterized protein (AIM24 family)
MPRRISITDLTADVRSGMGYSALSRKYRVSRERLEEFLQKLVDKGVLQESEIAGIGPSAPTAALDVPPPAVPKSSAVEVPAVTRRPNKVTARPTGGRRYTIAEFVKATEEKDRKQGLFELEGDRVLEINLNGRVWTKMGSMVAYVGTIKFTREGVLEKGMGKLLKKAVSGEGTRLTKAEGEGTLYLADSGKKISILTLENDSIYVNGNDVLAFEDSIEWDIKLMKKISSMLAGGLTNIRLEGTGMVAITTHHQPLTLRVTSDKPVVTDPNATVAWSGSLEPQLKTDVSIKTFLGRGSGESIQMRFQGDGFVVIQPFEEVYFQG